VIAAGSAYATTRSKSADTETHGRAALAGAATIVFLSVGDPIAMGLVDSLAHLGRNATGFSDLLAELSGKLVDIARELNGPRDTLDYVWYPAWPDGQNRYDATERAASAPGLELAHLELKARPIDA
jgi:putative tryptophan/tyrosine transport system substrate-binding protein